MKILVCGSRNWTDRATIRRELEALMPPGALTDDQLPTIIHGAARGADRIAGEEAVDLGFWVGEHPADWKRHGRAAGPIRNQEMLAQRPDLVLAFGSGRGTSHMVGIAEKAGVPVRRVAS